jgi:hypothetical protein
VGNFEEGHPHRSVLDRGPDLLAGKDAHLRSNLAIAPKITYEVIPTIDEVLAKIEIDFLHHVTRITRVTILGMNSAASRYLVVSRSNQLLAIIPKLSRKKTVRLKITRKRMKGRKKMYHHLLRKNPKDLQVWTKRMASSNNRMVLSPMLK